MARPTPAPAAVAPPPEAMSHVRDLLARPLVTCTVGTPIQAAARTMAEQDTNAIVVVRATGEALGIVTDSDLRRRVVAAGLPGTTPVERVMSTPLVTIDASALFFEAVHTMLRHHLHHLVVLADGRPLGVLADSDLLAARAQGPLLLARQIEQARSLDQLVELQPRREQAMRVLVRAGVSAYDLARITAETNDHLVRRILALVEAALGPPPLPYCWLGLGSEGRCEQALKTDQDNALVYQDPPPELAEPAQQYFAALAERVVAALERCGFPRCKGGVMASNPRWCQPLQVWRSYFAHWVRRPEPAALLNAAIFFDLRAVAGASALADALWADLATWIPESPLFSILLLREALNHRPPLGIFRTFVVERSGEHRGGFDLKTRGLLPVVEAARAYALARGITTTNTIERLRALRACEALNARDADDLIAAYEFLMSLRIRHHLDQLAAGQPLDNYIVPEQLSRAERHALKEHFKVIADLQAYIESQLLPGMAG
jgi:CBS domain-containing protein